MATLTTKRLLLRHWQPSDLLPFQEMSADPEVMAFIGDGRPRSPEESAVNFQSISRGWETRPFGLFAVELLSDASFIGFCGLSEPTFLPEVLPNIELGWRLRRSAWGQGLGSEAAQAVTDWAFETLMYDRLISVIHVDNVSSKRLAKGIGMSRERRTIVPKNSVWVDVFELERESWLDSDEL